MKQVVRPVSVPAISPRARWLVVLGVLLVLLFLYGWFALNFHRQRQVQRRLQADLYRYQAFVATVAPTLADAERLEQQWALARARLATAEARFLSADRGPDAVSTLVALGTRFGVTVEQVNATSTVVDPPLAQHHYTVRFAAGSLDDLTAFVNAIQDAFPASRLQEVRVERQEDAYHLSGTLVVLTLAESRGLTPSPTLTDSQRAEELRTRYEQAMAQQDYELALSLLMRLAVLESDRAELDDLFYQTYVAYGNALLDQGYLDAAEAQFREALAIRPDGEEAVLGLLQVSQRRTATPSPTQAGGAVQATPTPPAVPTLTPTLPPTQPPPPTNTPAPTRTPVPTRTPGPSPTATSTPGPTSTPSPYQFGPTTPFYLPNCGLTQIKGTIKDEQGRPLNGVTVRVWWDGAAPDQVYSLPSGTDPRQPAGYWDVVLAPYPKEGKWYVAVVDRETGAYLSEVVTVFTDTRDCQPTGTGHQVVIIDFIRFVGQYGTPVPTSTPTKTPLPSPSPTSTPTNTPTPTITPTPTATPVRYQMSGGPLPIPEDINNPLQVSFNVVENFPIRAVQVFVYVEHDDTYDLRIELVTPHGEVILLQEEERTDEGGPDRISRWYGVEGSDLNRIKGKSSAGMWTLRITDTKPANTTGTLNNWILEIFP